MTHVLTFVQRDRRADLLVVTNMWPTQGRPGYGIYIRRQVDALRHCGSRIDVLYLHGGRSCAYPVAALRFAWASVAWRRRYRLVHVHTGEAALAARFFVGPPMVATYHGDDILGDYRADGSISPGRRLRRAVIRAHSRFFSATCTQSQQMRDMLPVRARQRSRVVPCGVDVGRFAPYDRLASRRRLGWSPTERIVLFAATRPDSPGKRRWLAEAACAYAAERLGEVRLHVTRGVAPERMPVLMNAADCLLHTAAVEGGPLVIKEALMCELPVVTTPAGDAADLLKGVSRSYLCRPDVQELGEALIQCLTSDGRGNARGEKAPIFSTANETRCLLELYAELGAGG